MNNEWWIIFTYIVEENYRPNLEKAGVKKQGRYIQLIAEKE